MIDLHCHILYGVDDGPQSLEDSIALARALVADGITKVVSTSHILNPPLSVEQIRIGIKQLQSEFSQLKIDLELIPGGENHYTLSLEEMQAHSINGGRYLLLEFPHDSLPPSAGELVFRLSSAGYIPIIAHPARNADVLRDPERLRPLIEQGALSQLTASSLTGVFGSAVRQCARYLLKKNLVHFLATDAHGADWRKPRMRAGLKEAGKLIGKDAACRLVHDNPAIVIENHAWLEF